MDMKEHSVVVYCGNGGDYEFERDRNLWRLWVKQNITSDHFIVIPHEDADKAIIVFEASKWVTIFRLKSPEFIMPHMVLPNGLWMI